MASTNAPTNSAPGPLASGSTTTPATANRPPLISSISQTGDIALWLHNKLGTSNDLWSDNSSIISQLNKEVLQQIKNIFSELQVNVKLKLLLTFLHISRRNLEDWAGELEKILELGMHDNDPWVSVVSGMLRNYPRQGTINYEFQSNSSTFMDLVNEIKKLVKKHGDRGILPLECLYLNRPVFIANYGQVPQPDKHFTLRRKAKSATLRAELLQKATDASTGRRSTTGPAVPIRCRGLNSDSTPLKGIPSRTSFSSSGYNSYNSGYGSKQGLSRLGSLGSSTSTPSGSLNRLARFASLSGSNSMNSKRDGGIVILDINEAPSTLRDPKRRKTTSNLVDDKKANNSETSENLTATATVVTPAPSTPTVTTSPTLISTPASSLILGHKSAIAEQELPGTKKAFHGVDPYDISHELAQTEPVRPAAATTGITASKSTPDYAAGLLGTTNSSHLLNRYGASHDQLGQSPAKPSLSGMSLLSNPASSTHPGMYSKLPDLLSSSLSKTSNSILTPNSSNMFNVNSTPPSSNIATPMSSPSVASSQGYFKTSSLQQQQPQPQSQQQIPQQSQQTQQQQVSNTYRNYVNPYEAQPQRMVQPQPQSSQPIQPAPVTPTTPINTIYGTIRPQTNQPPLQGQQQPQQPQRLMYNPASPSIVSQQNQTRPLNQSVIHANPQQPSQPMQQNQQMQFGNSSLQQQRPFGMYGQMNQGAKAPQPPAQRLQVSQAVPTQQQSPNRVVIAREITQQASLIFNSSNCLTRPEKALILGFMAGTQSNPAPRCGPVCMIRYLERLEEHQTTSGETVPVLVEEHFQMNFNTLEWKTVRSIRQADPNYQVRPQDNMGNQTRIVVLDQSQSHHFVTTNAGRAQQPVMISNTAVSGQGHQQQHPMAIGMQQPMMTRQPVRQGAPGAQYMPNSGPIH